MKINEELVIAQAALEQMNCRDVKFFFAPRAAEEPRSAVSSDAARFLQAYVDGKYDDGQVIGDRAVA